MRLAIIGDTRHSRDASGRLCTLSPLVRQLRPWLERFDEVTYCGTFAPGNPPANHEPYPFPHVRLRVLPPGGGLDLRGKVGLLRCVTRWWPVLRRTLREADVVHFRCPCNVALIGMLALQGMKTRPFAVYAGNWGGYPGESPFYRLQRRWLNQRDFGGPVAVYGSWPDQPEHVLTSFSPSFTRGDWEADRSEVEEKLARSRALERIPLLRAVTVGHLNQDKNQGSILRALALLRREGIEVDLEVLGEGPERPRLHALARELGLEDRVHLRGRVSLREVRRAYARAHVGILASLTEGFPRVLAEAMAGGAVPIASEVGINAQILAHGERGLIFPFNQHVALAARLHEAATDPSGLARRAEAGRDYTRGITLESFYELQDHILTDRLGVPRAEAARVLEVAA